MVFTINGENWILQFVRPNSEKLRRSDGVYTLGVTDNNTKKVSIARGMSDYMTNKVLCHELVHCYSFSYDCHIDMPTEEIIADFMSLYLRPDGKTQVTVEYDESGAPKRVDTIVISSQHSADVSLDQIRSDIVKYVIKPIVPENLLDDDTIIYVNPTGRFVTGGPAGDSGLTGRKIIVDTYGGIGRHGGGCFSGKDPTKVDRSAAYAARYVAKNIVAAGLAKKCEIQIAYAIGVAHPVSVMIDTFGTGIISDDTLSEIVTETFDLRPAAIIDSLDLRRPIYRQLAAYGHMGRTDLDLPWEKTDAVDALLANV